MAQEFPIMMWINIFSQIFCFKCMAWSRNISLETRHLAVSALLLAMDMPSVATNIVALRAWYFLDSKRHPNILWINKVWAENRRNVKRKEKIFVWWVTQHTTSSSGIFPTSMTSSVPSNAKTSNVQSSAPPLWPLVCQKTAKTSKVQSPASTVNNHENPPLKPET